MTVRNNFEIGNVRQYHSPDAPVAHVEKGCPYDRPSVTTLLKSISSPALVPWAAGAVAREAIRALREDFEDGTHDAVGKWASNDGTPWASNDEMFDKARRYLQQAPTRIRDTAADMGTFIHECADALARGEALPPLPEGVSQAEVEAFVEQFERWRDGYQANFVWTEVEVHNPDEGYAGRFDSVMTTPDGETLLCDLKTGKGVYDTVALQLAAYGHASIWSPNGHWLPIRCDGYAVLHLRPDGFRFLRINVTEADWQAFLAAKRLWKWQQAMRKNEWAEIALPVEVTA
jgi:hypothetical protein